MNKYQALQSFWESFGWAAYNENTVPDDALDKNNNRYITYEAASDALGSELLLSASLWHRSNSWTTIHAKAAEILRYIEIEMPPSIPIDGGRMKVRKAEPYAQDSADDDDTIRRVRLNVYVEFLTAY